jgi:hypothetical protein
MTKSLLPCKLFLLFVVVIEHAQSFEQRQLQQEAFLYRANYSAEFQALRDTFCIADPPILQLSCFGKNMTILGTSNETIVCTEMAVPAFENGTSYECVNTCSGSECERIYLANDNRPSSEGPFGSIQFMCRGNDVRQIAAFFNYLGGNNGTCAATSGTLTRNLHIARLGVSCPVGSTRAYTYDDTYFECDSAAALPFDAVDDPGDVYSCEAGRDCDGQACNVAFGDIYINAYVPQFIDTCVEATIPITAFPTPAPALPVSGGVRVSARFQAAWGNLFDSTESLAACTTENPTVILACENGASIEYVLSIDNAANCTRISESELRCSGDATNILNEFISAIFVSLGFNVYLTTNTNRKWLNRYLLVIFPV